jgi:uncharacterized protein YqhQ
MELELHLFLSLDIQNGLFLVFPKNIALFYNKVDSSSQLNLTPEVPRFLLLHSAVYIQTSKNIRRIYPFRPQDHLLPLVSDVMEGLKGELRGS